MNTIAYNKTLITVKTDKDLKIAAQKTAEKLGFSLGTLVNAYLRQFVRTQEVNFSVQKRPSKRLLNSIRIAEKEIASGKLKKFRNIEELMTDLYSR